MSNTTSLRTALLANPVGLAGVAATACAGRLPSHLTTEDMAAPAYWSAYAEESVSPLSLSMDRAVRAAYVAFRAAFCGAMARHVAHVLAVRAEQRASVAA